MPPRRTATNGEPCSWPPGPGRRPGSAARPKRLRGAGDHRRCASRTSRSRARQSAQCRRSGEAATGLPSRSVVAAALDLTRDIRLAQVPIGRDDRSCRARTAYVGHRPRYASGGVPGWWLTGVCRARGQDQRTSVDAARCWVSGAGGRLGVPRRGCDGRPGWSQEPLEPVSSVSRIGCPASAGWLRGVGEAGRLQAVAKLWSDGGGQFQGCGEDLGGGRS